MPKKASETKNTLRETILESFVNEYKELADTWRNLETKAQGTAGIAGIFIAGALGYLHDLSGSVYLYEKIFLTVTIACLVSTVVSSVLVLRIRKISSPPLGEYMDKLINDLFEIDDDKDFFERVPLVVTDRISAWKRVIHDAAASNAVKAKHLWRAQLFLITAIISVALLILSKIYR